MLKIKANLGTESKPLSSDSINTLSGVSSWHDLHWYAIAVN